MKNANSPSFQTKIDGLTTQQARENQRRFGKNELVSARRNHLLDSLWNIVREPMFILLVVACVLYFFLGDLTEAVMMLVSIFFVAGIEIYQETKSEKALDALREFTKTRVRVRRDGHWLEIPSEEIVPGDLVSIGEGERVPADGELMQQNDLSVEEAVLTGENLPVEKQLVAGKNLLFQGTTLASGQGIFKITATGNQTELGKLGKSIESIESAPTPLQKQITRFVRQMGLVGLVAFGIVLVFNLWLENDFWKALLFSLTLAMAILPQEIPVAFSTFMALGAFRMIKAGILVKQPKTVDSLGSATVICLDKTGTITENRMSVAETVDFSPAETDDGGDKIVKLAWWASEPQPIDAMEKALQSRVLADFGSDFRKNFKLIKEYALSGVPPMMTHVWELEIGELVTGELVTNNQFPNSPITNSPIIACKGAVERVLKVCGAGEELTQKVLERTEEKAALGYRVLGVASAVLPAENIKTNIQFPENQDGFDWKFEGIVAFYDPPKSNAAEVFQQFYGAKIRVMMITGDHAATAKNIARAVGLDAWEIALTGSEVMSFDEKALREAVGKVNVFARMFPEAKLRVVNALKSNGETVAMSGDGVNDGPALKSAQIGVAMGKKGTDIAKSAASLVLLEDNLGSMATAIGMGRRIYNNLRKAIRYVISIHVPIILTVLVPLVLGWEYPHIFLPLHVIFLELVMDPVAAIGFENEPAEPNLMQKPPRPGNAALFSNRELLFSLLQGLVIGAAVLFAYQFAAAKNYPENGVRAFVFTTMVFANLFLTLANRSFDFPIYRTIFYKNRTLPLILGVSTLMLAAVLYLPFVSRLFRVDALSATDLGWCLLLGFLSVAWFEVWKMVRISPKIKTPTLPLPKPY